VRNRDGDESGGELFAGSGAAADDGFSGEGLNREGERKRIAKAFGEGGGALLQVGGSGADHLKGGNFVEGAAEVGAKCRGEGSEGEFIDAKGAEERIATGFFDEFTFAGDDAGLRAAEEFVSAEGDEIDADGETFAGGGLVEAEGMKIGEATRAEVFEKRDFRFAAEFDEVAKYGAGGEAGDAKVGGVDAEEEFGARREGALVIGDAGAISGPYFADDRAAGGHDVRDAEAVANFDELAAGDDDFGVFGEGVEDQEDGGGVVVDDDGGFGAGGEGEEAGDVSVTLAALAGREVEFEIGVTLSGCGDGSCGR
jgi:hypothetical protein